MKVRTTSDVERLAKARIFIGSVVIYLLSMGFLEAGEQLYGGTPHVLYTRLATIPFFLLLMRRWLRLVRVRPPRALMEARQLAALGRHRAARDKYAGPLLEVDAARLDRARRLLQDGLAVPLRAEAWLEAGRCSLQLGELARAVDELGRAREQVPQRADVAIDLAEALSRQEQDEAAAGALREALPYMDAVDVATLREHPALMRLLDPTPLPRRSVFARKIMIERAWAGVLVAAAVAHGLHLYLGLF